MSANKLPVADEDSFCAKQKNFAAGTGGVKRFRGQPALSRVKLNFYFFPAFFGEGDQVLPPDNPDQGER